MKFWIFIGASSFGYSSVHSFYPNMSKFFQERFDFSNTEAGSISSVPYLIASFTVPIIGTLVQKVGDKHYEVILMASLGLICITHMSYLLMPDFH